MRGSASDRKIRSVTGPPCAWSHGGAELRIFGQGTLSMIGESVDRLLGCRGDSMLAVGRRPGRVEIVWRQGTEAFAFLIGQWDFVGPERTDDGLVLPPVRSARPHWDLGVEERSPASRPRCARWTRPPASSRAPGLGCLYVHAGLGPPQHVPRQPRRRAHDRQACGPARRCLAAAHAVRHRTSGGRALPSLSRRSPHGSAAVIRAGAVAAAKVRVMRKQGIR